MPQFTTRPEIIGTFGVAASTHWLASQSAMRMLEIGGNAFDAAVAGALVLNVAEPHLNGPLGEVPIIFHDADADETRVICGQGPAPAAATIEAFAAAGVTDIVPGNGLMAAAVPGAFDAWMRLLAERGTLDLETVMAPAIGYAEHGVPLVAKACDLIAANADVFRAHWPTSAAVYLPHGEVPRPGALFANRQLAATWSRVLAETAGTSGREARIAAARRVWSQGFLADAVERWRRTARALDQTGRKNAAFLTGEDMARWSAGIEDPVSLDYAGHRVLKCGPWSQGPAMLQALALLDGLAVADMDPAGDGFVHTVTEAVKLALADRDTFYGDPDFVDVPLDELLSAAYANARRGLIADTASLDYRPGKIAGFGHPPDFEAAKARAALAEELAAMGQGEPTTANVPVASVGPASGDTCYICVIDAAGNMVSATPSGGWLATSPVIPDLGFPIGTRLQMVWLDPRSPGALRPGARPRTTLTPTMVLRDDGTPYMCIGSPGGDSQDQWQLICLLRHLHQGMNLQEAIDAPSFHSEHVPSSFYPRPAKPGRVMIESRFSAATLAALADRGHDLDIGEDWSEGRLAAASRPGDGTLRAGANPRGMQGYAVGR